VTGSAFEWIHVCVGSKPANTLEPESARQLVRDMVAERFPDATAAILFGSILSNSAKRFSDVDVLIIVPCSDTLEKQRFIYHQIMFEAAVVSLSLLPRLGQISKRFGIPIGLNAIAHGDIVAGHIPGLQADRSEAARVLDELSRSPARSNASSRHQVMHDLMSVADAPTDASRTVLAIHLLGKLSNLFVEQHNGVAKATRREMKEFSSNALADVLKRLSNTVSQGDWTAFSNLVRFEIFPGHFDWDHTAKFI
jgi:Nucleotidyltransferase domain